MKKRKVICFIALILITASINIEAQWKLQNLYPNLRYINSTIFFDSQNGLGAAEKLVKTTDGGKSWLPIEIDNYSQNSKFFRISEYVIWMLSSSGNSLRSTDKGTTWNVFPDNQTFRLLSLNFLDAITGFGIGYKLNNYGQHIIYKTTDGGWSWEEIFTCPPWYNALNINFTSGKKGYLSGVGYFYKTTDGGQNWLPVTIDTTFKYFAFSACSFISDSVGIISGLISRNDAPDTYKGLTLKTIDGGNIWKATNQGFNAMSFYDKKTGYACGSNGLISKTTDYGESWININPQLNAYMTTVAVINPDEAIITGDGEPNKFLTIVKTTNSGNSWERYDSGRIYKFNTLKFINKKTGWGGCENGEIFKTTNGGVDWLQQRVGNSNEIIQAGYFLDTLYGWYLIRDPSFFQTTIVRTTNGGKNWDSLFAIPYSIYSVYFHNKSSGFICGSGGRIYRTTNGGITWKYVSTSFSSYTLTKIIFTDENHGWAAGDKYVVIKTTDGGATWFSNLYSWGKYNDIAFADSIHGWATGVCGNIDLPFIRTTDGGNTWSAFRLNLPSQMYGITFPSVKTGYAIGSSGVVCKTADSGATWHQLNFPDSKDIYDINFADDSTGWAVTEYGLIYNTTNGGEKPVNAVNEENKSTSKNFYLSQNYPNPFNPATTIKYTIPQESRVSIIIYNTLGQKIKELVNETKPTGSYQVTLDGTGLPSGIYFYRLTTGSFSQTKKLIFMK